MKLPLTDLFGYVYNWQTWVNKEEWWLYTFSGMGVLLGQILGGTLLLLCTLNDKYLNKIVDDDNILWGIGIVYCLLLVYISVAFLVHKRYKTFVYDEKYAGKRGRIKMLIIMVLAAIYMFAGFLSPCYL